MKKIAELRALNVKELEEELYALRRAQLTWRIQKKMGTPGKPHLLLQMRRGIARIKTIMLEKVK